MTITPGDFWVEIQEKKTLSLWICQLSGDKDFYFLEESHRSAPHSSAAPHQSARGAGHRINPQASQVRQIFPANRYLT
jgi:hypothetical protein